MWAHGRFAFTRESSLLLPPIPTRILKKSAPPTFFFFSLKGERGGLREKERGTRAPPSTHGFTAPTGPLGSGSRSPCCSSPGVAGTPGLEGQPPAGSRGSAARGGYGAQDSARGLRRGSSRPPTHRTTRLTRAGAPLLRGRRRGHFVQNEEPRPSSRTVLPSNPCPSEWEESGNARRTGAEIERRIAHPAGSMAQ